MANVLTNDGKAWIVDKINALIASAVQPEWVEWGSGAGTAAATDTAVFGTLPEARASCAMSQPASDTVQMVGLLTATTARTVTNAGISTASAAGAFILHSDFTGVALNSGDAMQFTFSLQIT